MLRVFKADQQSRYLLINRETTAREAANLAIREFGLTAGPEAYSLCEVSVTPEGVIKQRRLPDQLNKLADRIQLCARCASASNLTLITKGFTVLVFVFLKENILQFWLAVLFFFLFFKNENNIADFAVFLF